MATRALILRPGYFPLFDKGSPVSSGYIYIGEPDLDPEIVANQKAITFLQENGTEVPGSQPVRTSAGGVPTYNGSPVTVLIDGDYSVKVLNKDQTQEYYVPSNVELIKPSQIEPHSIGRDQVNSEIVTAVLSVNDLAALEGVPDNSVIRWAYYANPNDAGGNVGRVDTGSSATDDGGSVFEMADGSRVLVDGPITAAQFGYDGTAGTSSRLDAFADWGGRELHGDIEYAGILGLPELGDYSGLVINGVSVRRAADMRSYFFEKPADFDWDVLGHRFWLDANGLLASSINPNDYDVAGNAVSPAEYFVEVGGDGGPTNPGDDPADPVAGIYRALDLIDSNGDTDAIIWCRPGYYTDGGVWGTNRPVTSNVSIKPWNGATSAPYDDETGDPVIVTTESTGLTWTATGSGSYSTTRSAVCSVVDEAILNSIGDWDFYSKVDSVAECDSTPGTWHQDGSTLYVHTADSRAPDSDVHPYVSKDNGQSGEGDYTLYCKKVWFYGGDIAFKGDTTNAANTETVFLDSCRLRYAEANGSQHYGTKHVIHYECDSSYNGNDGFNYHADLNTRTKLTYNIEFNSSGFRNGYAWSSLLDVNNGSTTHDGVYIARAGTVAFENQGPNIVDVGGGKSWCMHCQGRKSQPVTVDNSSADFYVSENQMWLDHCDAEGSNYSLVTTGSGAEMNVRRSNIYPRIYVAQNVSGW